MVPERSVAPEVIPRDLLETYSRDRGYLNTRKEGWKAPYGGTPPGWVNAPGSYARGAGSHGTHAPLHFDLDPFSEVTENIICRAMVWLSTSSSILPPLTSSRAPRALRCIQALLLPERGALHPELPVVLGPGERDRLYRRDDVSRLGTGRPAP